MLVKITTKHASYSLVTFVTHKRFAVLLRKLTIATAADYDNVYEYMLSKVG